MHVGAFMSSVSTRVITTCLRKRRLYGLPFVSFVKCRQFVHIVLAFLVFRVIVLLPDNFLPFLLCKAKYTYLQRIV